MKYLYLFNLIYIQRKLPIDQYSYTIYFESLNFI